MSTETRTKEELLLHVVMQPPVQFSDRTWLLMALQYAIPYLTTLAVLPSVAQD